MVGAMLGEDRQHALLPRYLVGRRSGLPRAGHARTGPTSRGPVRTGRRTRLDVVVLMGRRTALGPHRCRHHPSSSIGGGCVPGPRPSSSTLSTARSLEVDVDEHGLLAGCSHQGENAVRSSMRTTRPRLLGYLVMDAELEPRRGSRRGDGRSLAGRPVRKSSLPLPRHGRTAGVVVSGRRHPARPGQVPGGADGSHDDEQLE